MPYKDNPLQPPTPTVLKGEPTETDLRKIAHVLTRTTHHLRPRDVSTRSGVGLRATFTGLEVMTRDGRVGMGSDGKYFAL